MAFAQWPETLPTPMLEHSQQMEAGKRGASLEYYAEQSRSYPEHVESMAMNLNSTELAAWRTFVGTTLHGGGSVFEATWLSYLGYGSHVARIVSPWSMELAGNQWTVSFGLEILSLEAA